MTHDHEKQVRIGGDSRFAAPAWEDLHWLTTGFAAGLRPRRALDPGIAPTLVAPPGKVL